MILLDLHNIRKVYGKGDAQVVAIDTVDLNIKKGEIVLIMGPSGSGKTTLLSIAGGLLRPTEGKVLLNNQNILSLSSDKLSAVRLMHLGFIFQSFNLLAALTALENVQVVLELAGVRSALAKERGIELLTRLGMGNRLSFKPENLSGGEKQRVSIARALANNPSVILADEPTANLDSKNGHEVMELLREIAKNEQRTVIIVSHDVRIKDIADRVLWLEDGKFKKIAIERKK